MPHKFFDLNPLALEVLPAQKHALTSFLMNNGVSVIGAQQFADGLYIVSPRDRKLLASLMSRIVQGGGVTACDPYIKF